MPGRSAFLSQRLVPLWLACFSLPLSAQTYTVDPGKTITFEVRGATAAYTLEAFYADATAENGVVALTGKQPGGTHVVVVTASGVQTFEIVITKPPPHYPKGFIKPFSFDSMTEGGYYELRYFSSPSQIQNQLDFSNRQGDKTIHAHVVGTNLFGSLDQNQSRTTLSSAFYQILTPHRDITVLDQYIDESPLTINGSIVRGLHYRQDNWFLHAGYTSVAVFEGLFLPTQPEGMFESGYRHPLTANSSLTGSLYYFRVPSSDQIGRGGPLATVAYKYSPREDFWLTADAGASHGIGGSARVYYKGDRDNLRGNIRYAPAMFASLGSNNLRGFHSDVSWIRHLNRKLDSDLTFYSNKLMLPGFQETTITGSVNLQYHLTPHWALIGGIMGSSFQTRTPPGAAIRNLNAPAGLSFQSSHFGAMAQYQFSRAGSQNTGGQQFRTSVHFGVRAINITLFAARQKQAPSLAFILGQTQGLQQTLDLLGIKATTVQQVDELLTENSFLLAAGYIKGATINVVPIRTQSGGTVTWMGSGVYRPRLNYSFLLDNDQALSGSLQTVSHTMALTQKISASNDLSLSCSVFRVQTPERPSSYNPLCSLALRHQFASAPAFIIPQRHGFISGHVFQDENSKGSFAAGMTPIPDVEIVLDEVRRTRTGADGVFRFSRVPVGKHKIFVAYKSNKPFFFTTQSDVEVDENAKVDFGIGHSLSGLMGRLASDANQGVAGATIVVRNKDSRWNAISNADGSFFVPQIPAGDYEVSVEEDSLPAGYSTGDLKSEPVTVGTAAPGKVSFTVRALRTISGRVLTYDRSAGRYVPVAATTVTLKERSLISTTDAMGRFLFRDLPAGAYSLSVTSQARSFTRSAQLGSGPFALADADIRIDANLPSQPSAAVHAALPAEARVILRPKIIPPVQKSESPPRPLDYAAAQKHNSIGAQLAQAGQYQEAIIELTEAIRIAPDFAAAYNARGCAWFRLHNYVRTISDLNSAIRLHPNYANVFNVLLIRGVARKAVGDLTGSADDLKRAKALAQ